MMNIEQIVDIFLPLVEPGGRDRIVGHHRLQRRADHQDGKMGIMFAGKIDRLVDVRRGVPRSDDGEDGLESHCMPPLHLS